MSKFIDFMHLIAFFLFIHITTVFEGSKIVSSTKFKIKYRMTNTAYFVTSTFKAENEIQSFANLKYYQCLKQCETYTNCIMVLYYNFNSTYSLCSMFYSEPVLNSEFNPSSEKVKSQLYITKKGKSF